MPKAWLYFIGLVLPLIVSLLALHTGAAEWLWNQGYPRAFAALNALRGNGLFLQFVAGWPFPVFILTVVAWRVMNEDDDNLTQQFLLLPILYVPFTVIGAILLTAQFDPTNLITHPLVILPFGYLYILSWAAIVRLLDKLGLVM